MRLLRNVAFAFIAVATITPFGIANAESTVSLMLTRPLFVGTHGSDVSALQQFLKDKGYFTYPAITGYFGPVTEKAVKTFQNDNAIEAVGIVGPKTRVMIASLTGNPSSFPAGDQSSSATSSTTTSAAPTLATSTPPAPLMLRLTSYDNRHISIAWNPVPGTVSYSVKRKENATADGYATIASNIVATAYMDAQVIAHTAYSYVVTASNAGGESLPSSPVTAEARSLESSPTPPAAAAAPAAPPLAGVTWDPATITAGLTLSNGNLTGSAVVVAKQYSALSTVSKNSGKFYVEASLIDAFGAGSADTGFGIAFPSYDSTSGNSGIGEETPSDSIALWTDGKVWKTGSPPADVGLPIVDSTDTVGLAIDIDAGKGWFSVNGTFTGDPTAGTGASFTFTPGTTIRFAMTTYGDGASVAGSVAANFGATSFQYSPPAGFNQ
jgi:peptidoglycan hydrolase-like protein with peptidoglycan-binding domain